MKREYEPANEKRGLERIGQKVVSVRMDTELIEELDALAARTGRSRGFYLRAAVQEMIPVLKERYWHHDTETRQEQLDKYNRFMDQLQPPEDT
ncbi:ribbon-helix-helix domain-containing protein [Brachybacterium epidermidis]|uniref:ribbon-helix-helix domain-containing protein n=1 Tax=Brachybacterium epidermidis TaxID=2781983 RepID=UPI00398F2E32